MEPIRGEGLRGYTEVIQSQTEFGVVITGSASGIGLAIAERFVEAGSRVHICDIDEDRLEGTLRTHVGMTGCRADVSRPEDSKYLIESARSQIGDIDVLVNNAGIGGPAECADKLNISDWDDVISTNLSGPFYCARAIIPHLKSKKQGCIINISTSSTRTLPHNRSPYIAAKTGLEGLTKALARELGPFGIRCNAILPGLVDNERGSKLVRHHAEIHGISEAEAEAEFLKYISLRTRILPREIADVALFLAGPAGRKVTGQLLAVDGHCEWEE